MIVLAILPLQQGPTSEAYAGLGTPLAGMLVADLAQVEGVTLVERSQLDALQDEIELSGSGAIDPASAIEAGKLLGADHVVIGSYSVVGDTLALEARIVEVATGTVREAASASGPVAEFVVVEDALAEQLVPDLGGTWSQPAAVPTSNFEAFAAYGAGLWQAETGQNKKAIASWAQALELDPEYDEARAALARLKIDLATRQQVRVDDAVESWTANREKVVAEVPSRVPKRASVDQLAAFGVRLHALKQLDRHCERYEDMVRYVQDHGLPEKPANKDDERLQAATAALWVQWGIVDSQVKADRSAWRTTPTLWRSGAHYLFDLSGWITDEDIAGGDGLLSSLHACFPPEERLAEVEKLQVLADSRQDFDTDRGVTLDQALSLHAHWTAAATGQLAPRVGDLEALVAELDDAVWADKRVADILRAAEWYERSQAARLGLTDEALWGLTHAIAAQDAAVLVTQGATCAEVLRQKQPLAEHRVEQLAAGDLETADADLLWTVVAATRDFGCVKDHPARWETAAQVYAHVQSAPDRARLEHIERCAPAFQDLAERYQPAALVSESTYEGMDAMQAVVAWDEYLRSLVLPLCVND